MKFELDVHKYKPISSLKDAWAGDRLAIDRRPIRGAVVFDGDLAGRHNDDGMIARDLAIDETNVALR